MILASILITDGDTKDQSLAPAVLENIETFKRHHSGLEHHLFRADETRAFIAAEYGKDVLGVFDALKPYAFKSDLARLCIMHKHGGLYADLSVYFVGGWKPPSGKLAVFRDFFCDIPWQTANTVFFAPPGHKALAKGIELICQNVRDRYYGIHFLCPTGPACFGKAIAMSCEANDLVVGESVRFREVPGHPGLLPQGGHGFAFCMNLVAVKRKRIGGGPEEMGISGGNGYMQMWQKRDIYN
jgi:hypothetical protein